MKQLISNRNLYLKIEGYSRRIDWLLTENPKAKGKHEKKSCFGKLGHYQIVKKHSNKT